MNTTRSSGFAALLLLVPASITSGAGPVEKKLIEFGWDEPDTAFMRRHVDQLEKSPFDGCVFHVNYRKADGKNGSFTWDSWGKQSFSEADVKQAIDDLKNTPFKRCKANFLRFNTTPADIDWFDDHTAVLNNARLAAHIAKEGGCPGLLFDIEQYNAPLFQYTKQRDKDRKSWDEYAAQVRRRGREVMGAFQEGFPDLVVFLTFGYSLPWDDHAGPNHTPLPQCGYGLLAPFMDGLVEAAKGRTRLVDGFEIAYRFRQPAQFPNGYRMMEKDLLPIVADPKKYRQVFTFSFGLWLDFDWRGAGWNTEDVTKNIHTPEQFEVLTRKVLETADEYVWIYTETPRWWSDEGKPVKLPPAYDAALRKAKRPTATATQPN
jgi:hypothetical protein